MISRMVYVRCDECGTPAQLGDDADEARAIARNEGFIRENGKDLCKSCSERVS